MTGEYAENPKVFGRWQPRMLETDEAAEAFLQLLARSADDTNGKLYELTVDPDKKRAARATFSSAGARSASRWTKRRSPGAKRPR